MFINEFITLIKKYLGLRKERDLWQQLTVFWFENITKRTDISSIDKTQGFVILNKMTCIVIVMRLTVDSQLIRR
jgi:hypothetical protein